MFMEVISIYKQISYVVKPIQDSKFQEFFLRKTQKALLIYKTIIQTISASISRYVQGLNQIFFRHRK